MIAFALLGLAIVALAAVVIGIVALLAPDVLDNDRPSTGCPEQPQRKDAP